MTLRRRLALVNVIVLLIALLLLAAIVFNRLTHDLREQLDQDLAQMSAQELTRIEVVNHTLAFAANNRQLPAQMRLAGFARLLDANGHITDGLGAYTTAPVLLETLQTPPEGALFDQTNTDGLLLRVFSRPILAGNRVVGYLQVATVQ